MWIPVQKSPIKSLQNNLDVQSCHRILNLHPGNALMETIEKAPANENPIHQPPC